MASPPNVVLVEDGDEVPDDIIDGGDALSQPEGHVLVLEADDGVTQVEDVPWGWGGGGGWLGWCECLYTG